MSTIMPQSELLRQAIAWIGDALDEKPDRRVETVVDDAAMRFNLGPRDVEFLLRFFKDKPDDSSR